jgi:outer membrane protein assembly factor BamD (BamD/ComL family)
MPAGREMDALVWLMMKGRLEEGLLMCRYVDGDVQPHDDYPAGHISPPPASTDLDVAWQAFRLKKAYKGVIMRFDETFAAYPEFSKMDEFLYLAGMSSYYLADNKGKQKVDVNMEKEKRFAPERLREDATVYLSMIIDKYPQSKYREEAEKTLAELQARPTTTATTSN